MYFQIGPEKIYLDFNNGITAKVSGPDSLYYVECVEFKEIDHSPVSIGGYTISHNGSWPQNLYEIPIEFFFDFEIKFYKFSKEFGLQNFYSHRYNDYGQLVRFILEPESLEEGFMWIDKIKKYVRKRGCQIQTLSSYPELEFFSDTRYQSRDLSPYKTFKLGRYPKISQDWKSIDPRKEGLIWFGNWKTFWSYQHPRNWKDLSSEEIVTDILGL